MSDVEVSLSNPCDICCLDCQNCNICPDQTCRESHEICYKCFTLCESCPFCKRKYYEYERDEEDQKWKQLEREFNDFVRDGQYIEHQVLDVGDLVISFEPVYDKSAYRVIITLFKGQYQVVQRILIKDEQALTYKLKVDRVRIKVEQIMGKRQPLHISIGADGSRAIN